MAIWLRDRRKMEKSTKKKVDYLAKNTERDKILKKYQKNANFLSTKWHRETL